MYFSECGGPGGNRQKEEKKKHLDIVYQVIGTCDDIHG